MDLISREAVKAKARTVTEWTWQRGKFIGLAEVDDIPSAFEGMTNGEVLESVFPNVVIDRISDTCSVAAIRIGTEEIVSCYKKWLDSPYQKGGEGDKE